MYTEFNKHDVAVYAGYLDKDEKLLQSASGGIATALSEFMLEQGGSVVGVSYSEDFSKAEYTVIDKISDLHKLKGSKYIDSEKKNIYATVKALLEEEKKVLFIGLPCVVGALYHFLGSRPENLITCELICHGPTLPKVHSDYVTYLERKHKSKITEFSVRYKNGAWVPGYLRAKFQNGQVFQKPFYETEYGIAFATLGKESCYQCKFKGNNRQADLMVGDFWGATEADVFWNSYGVSCIFAETEKGDAFLKATSGIKLFPTTFERAVESNQMVIKSKSRHAKRDKFAEDLAKKDVIYAAKQTLSYRSRIRKIVFKFVPKGFKSKLAKLGRKILGR